MTCRHKDSWDLAGGSIEWCNTCGAFRLSLPASLGRAMPEPNSPWCRPGDDLDEFRDRKTPAWRKRRARLREGIRNPA